MANDNNGKTVHFISHTHERSAQMNGFLLRLCNESDARQSSKGHKTVFADFYRRHYLFLFRSILAIWLPNEFNRMRFRASIK